MKKMLMLLGVLVSTQAFGEVPPFYHSAKEVRAILDSKQVVKKLGIMSGIHSIVRNMNVYEVSAGACMLAVEVTYIAVPGLLGPGKMELKVGDPFCYFE